MLVAMLFVCFRVSVCLACLLTSPHHNLYPPTPQQAEQKSVAVLDKRICEALSYADEVVDVKKDETIEGMVSVKKHINTLGPVKTVVVSAGVRVDHALLTFGWVGGVFLKTTRNRISRSACVLSML